MLAIEPGLSFKRTLLHIRGTIYLHLCSRQKLFALGGESMIFGSCVAFFTVIVGHTGPATDISTASIVTHRGARRVFASRQASAAPDIGQASHVHPMYSTTGAYVPAKNQTMPCYFSGTACRAGGAIYPAAGANMVDSQLTINGEVVCTVTATPPMMYAAMFPSVIFDSTHFANGSVVTVTASGHDSLGNFFTGSGSSTVKNSAALYGRYDFEVISPGGPGQKGIPIVQAYCSFANILATQTVVPLGASDQGWKSSRFYGDLQTSGSSIVYVHTHGEHINQSWNPPTPPSDTFILADLDEIPRDAANSQSDYHILASTVFEKETYAIGTGGLPPYNPNGVPPIWLEFNDACYTGQNNAFASAFLYPYANAYGGWCENQTQLGWSIAKYTDQTAVCADAFWSLLLLGFTADEARVRIPMVYQNGSWTGDPRQLVQCWGDWNMRLHGVYTNSPGQETRWHT